MKTYSFPYSMGPGAALPRPIVRVAVTNPKNGRSVEVLALIATGWDMTTMKEEYLELLGLERGAQRQDDEAGETGAQGAIELEIALVELDTQARHSLGGRIPVRFGPITFDCVLGRALCLDLLQATFDGPNQKVMLTLG